DLRRPAERWCVMEDLRHRHGLWRGFFHTGSVHISDPICQIRNGNSSRERGGCLSISAGCTERELPAVSFIEGGYNSGRDEHPDNNVQTGAAYVASLINPFMASPSWKDSVFILTYDEAGGLYDHAVPQPAKSPDAIAPVDLQPDDVCSS